MGSRSQADFKRKYSWWWNSHISPKNSKWLQENLTDMDAKVKQMIKLIEEDADSFARRAEMYYKKRPELMQLVEEFYRAYRALAERYDHATVVLRQAHRMMAEAFPSQLPFALADDLPAGSVHEGEPRTPDMPPIRAFVYPDDLQEDALGFSSESNAFKRNGTFTEDSDTGTERKGLKQLNDMFGNQAKFAEGRARKGLNFFDADEKECKDSDSHDLRARVPSESERVSKAELEIVTLKNALAKLEAEREASLLQYHHSLERLSNLESEVSRAKEDSVGLNKRASKAESEVQNLKEALAKLETEREASVLQYRQCLDKISNLENSIFLAQKGAGELSNRASKAETEAHSLKEDLARLEAEKEASLVRHKQGLEKISYLEEKLRLAEEDAKRFCKRAEEADGEVENLRQTLIKLTAEKEAAAVQYQQCLERISILEHKLACAEEEVQRLNSNIDDGIAKFKDAEGRCLLLERSNQTMHSELESLSEKMAAQSEELTEKHKELGRLWTCIQEERLRFMEAETAFQTLQHLHSQSQEELRSMAAEFQTRTQMLESLELRNQNLQNEVEQVKLENKGLNEVNLTSALTIQNLQDEIARLRETIEKLEAEVELRVDQRNALQQEIYCLKEEINDLNKKNQSIVDQVESVGFRQESFVSSVRDLQEENVRLKEGCEKERGEKVSLQEKLEAMEKLVEKNALLENSLSDLNVELEEVREKVKGLEESCESLLADKSALISDKTTLVSQLLTATDNLLQLTEKNKFLETSLLAASAELEGLRLKLRSLEDSYLSLENEKSDLVTAKGSLISELDITQKRLVDIEKNFTDLKESYFSLEKEKESILTEARELRVSLDGQKMEYASLAQLSESQLAVLESKICSLEKESQCIKKKYEEELDRTVNDQMEIFVLQRCVHDLEENNLALLHQCHTLLEASKISDKLISELESEKLEQEMEVKSLLDQVKVLRMGLYHMLKTLDPDACEWYAEKAEQDHTLLKTVHDKLQETEDFLHKNQRLVTENSVLAILLQEMQVEVANLVTAKNSVDQDLRIRIEQFLISQGENEKLVEMNEDLKLKVMEGDRTEEVLKVELKNLQGQLLDLQGACRNLQEENCKVLDEQRFLTKSISDLGEEKCRLEEENCVAFVEIVSQDTISLILKNIILDMSLEIKELSENLDKFNDANDSLKEKAKMMEVELVRLHAVENENIELHKMVEDLKWKYGEIELIRADEEKRMLKLSGDYNQQSEKLKCIHEEKQKLETELCKLHGAYVQTKSREEHLNLELQKERDEIEVWESQAAALFGELQLSTIRESIFEAKVHELSEGLRDYNQQSEELRCIHEEKQKLETELCKLHGAYVQTKSREEHLNHELQKERDEIGVWESRAAALFGELQLSTIRESIFEAKVHELCEGLRGYSQQSEELKCIHEEKQKLETELCKLHGAYVQTKSREEHLNRELQKERGEIEVWESRAAALFGELQLSTIRESIFEAKVHELSEGLRDYNQQCEELKCIHEEKQKLETELCHLHGAFVQTKSREEHLNHELQKERDEIEVWESQAAALFGELQLSTIRESIFEAKVHELGEGLRDYNQQSDELKCIHEEKQKLETELYKLHGAYVQTKSREEHLNHELQKERDEIEVWESQAAALFGELRLSTIRESIFEAKVHELSEGLRDYNQQSEELKCIHEEKQKLETELCKVHGAYVQTKSREEHLNHELQKERDEIEVWESQAAALFGELQLSTIRESIFEVKAHELSEACEGLRDRICERTEEVDRLEERACALQRENGELEEQVTAYVKGLISLKNCLTSLENHTLPLANPNEVDETKDGVSLVHAEGHQQTSEEQNAMVPGGLADLQELHMRITTIERAVMEKERRSLLENSTVNSKLEDAMRQIEQLKSSSSFHGERVEMGKQKPTHEITEEGNEDVMTKDIVLDQISECSSHGISRRETLEPDDQMLEMWQTVDQDGSLDLTVGKAQKVTTAPTRKKHSREHPSSESLAEKEVGVDKLEISKRFSGSRQEGNEKKILERLDSDAQKLTNLQITVQDLKRKVEVTEKSKGGKGMEFDSVKEQLEESEEAVMRLFDVNRKLLNSVEDYSKSFEEKTALATDESGIIRRRKISEQARMVSEKIGRLQLEVQKLQFLLLKLDDENKSTAKTRTTESKTRVLLRDYLNGLTKTSLKSKKRFFCACVQPTTKGD